MLVSMMALTISPPVIAGYLPAWSIANYELARLKPATDVLYFSIQPNPDGTLDLSDIAAADLPRLRRAKEKYGFRLLICCGGWERSAGFYPMASHPEKRKRFVDNALAFCQVNQFDGIDLDWEHPANQAQADAYGELVRDLHARFSPTGRIVTAAIADWQPMSRTMVKNLDRVHVMSYDHEGRHATMADSKKDILHVRQMGFPSAKIVLGVPFYGRGLVDHGDEKSYADIMAAFSPPLSADEAGGYYFNGRDTIKAKADYAQAQGLAGVMIWEVTQDVTGPKSLLSTLRIALDD